MIINELHVILTFDAIKKLIFLNKNLGQINLLFFFKKKLSQSRLIYKDIFSLYIYTLR